MKLKDKVICIISHENWGGMLMSKHHYAAALAKRGNEVYFINHPDKKKELRRGQLQIVPSGITHLSIVKHRLLHPFFLKFRIPSVYKILTRSHIRRISRRIGRPIDIVWSFDSSNTLPLKYFSSNAFKIYMPVDGPFGHQDELSSCETADVIISVTDEILSRYESINKPKFKIGHGVADEFLEVRKEKNTAHPVAVGYSGSLLRTDIDSRTLLTLIKKYPEINFEFWGEYDAERSNIHLPQNVPDDVKSFIRELKSLPNVKLHGAVSPKTLAEGISRMDVLLVCYRMDCMNTHKVLEYLGTGNVVLSTSISAYNNRQDLLEMIAAGDENAYVRKFEEIIKNIEQYNSEGKKAMRREYAADHSYMGNVREIEGFLMQRQAH